MAAANSKKPTPPFPPQDIEPPGVEKEMTPAPRYKGEDYKASGKLHGKVAIVTGGDSGIGRSVAYLYAREGADVVITYLPEEERDVEQLRQDFEQLGKKLVSVCGDVCGYAFCERVVQAAIDEFGHLDILVNNAAYQKHVDSLEELSIEQWDKTFKTNIYGYFYMTKAALPRLGKGAVIINSGSVTGLEGSPRLLDYSSTKGAIHAFTKSLAQSLVERGIRVNAVAPGPVWTPLNPAERSEEETKTFGEGVPLGRPAQPEEMAPAYVYFASNADSSYVTGEIHALLGGETRAG